MMGSAPRRSRRGAAWKERLNMLMKAAPRVCAAFSAPAISGNSWCALWPLVQEVHHVAGGVLGGGGGARAPMCGARVGPLAHTPPAGPSCSRASGAVAVAAAPTRAVNMAVTSRKKFF